MLAPRKSRLIGTQMRAKKTVKEIQPMLTDITKFINTGLYGKSLWSVLTALRGPDADLGLFSDTTLDMWDVKCATTCVIRYALGLKGDIRDGNINQYAFTVKPDSKELAEYRQKIPYGHFGTHAREAFIALGLEWTKVNKLDADELKAKYKRRAIAKRRS